MYIYRYTGLHDTRCENWINVFDLLWAIGRTLVFLIRLRDETRKGSIYNLGPKLPFYFVGYYTKGVNVELIKI